jgi:Tol biopolymer transport system component
VWARDLQTGRENALTAGRVNVQQPKISADGTKVAYWEVDGRKQSISIVAAAGGLPRKLCEDCGPPTHVSAHGDKMLEESQSRSDAVILVDAASGKQTELARSREAPKVSPFAARFSPDEKWVVFHALANARPLARQLFIIPFRPAAPAPLDRQDWIAITGGSELDAEAYWSPNGNLLYFLSDRDGFRCIWAQGLDPSTKRPLGSPFAVQHFHHARNSLSGVGGSMAAIGLSVAKDKLVFALGDMTGNIWMSKREGRP